MKEKDDKEDLETNEKAEKILAEISNIYIYPLYIWEVQSFKSFYIKLY